MFSKTIRWENKDASIQLNDAPSTEKVLKKILRDRHGSTLVSVYPYRIYYEPWAPSDNFFCLDIRLTALNDFPQLLNERDFFFRQCRDKTDTSCKWIFDNEKDIELLSYC